MCQSVVFPPKKKTQHQHNYQKPSRDLTLQNLVTIFFSFLIFLLATFICTRSPFSLLFLCQNFFHLFFGFHLEQKIYTSLYNFLFPFFLSFQRSEFFLHFREFFQVSFLYFFLPASIHLFKLYIPKKNTSFPKPLKKITSTLFLEFLSQSIFLH